MASMFCVAACCATALETAEMPFLYVPLAAWCVANFCED